MNEIHVRFLDGTVLTCPYGTRAETLSDRFGSLTRPLVAVKANNEIIPLSTRLEVNTLLEPVVLDTPAGAAIYRRSLCFILAAAAKELMPARRLVVGHSLGNGYYYTLDEAGAPSHRGEDGGGPINHYDSGPSADELAALEGRMREIVASAEPIRCKRLSYADAMDIFEKNGQEDTCRLLDQMNEAAVKVNECRGFVDLAVSPLVPHTGILSTFEIRAYEGGFLLRYPMAKDSATIAPFEDSPRIFSVYKEYKKWGRIVDLSSVGRLNSLVSHRQIKDFIQVAEAFQSKKLVEIADLVYSKRDEVKLILIAGPSSSGKTTTAKRLSILLKVIGLEPFAISLDDYFLGRDATPKDEKGDPDFESLRALDVPYLNEQLVSLFRGKEIELPTFDFKTQKRRASGKKISLGRRTVIVIEGIHGLNDELTPQVDRDRKLKLYVSALTQLNLDDHNRIPTSDNRLIRRMVRDYQFRGHSASDTIKMWPNVQKGEKVHIFPYQDSADVAFNSALDYELSVLKVYAEPLLKSVKPTMPEYSEAARLLAFLGYFAPIPPQYVPGQSILREFIGESEFKY